ncbi:hypothetical protein [Streptomyces sp. NPDC002845]
MDAETSAEVAEDIRFMWLQLSLGIPPAKVMHGLSTAMKEHCRRGSMTLKEMTDVFVMTGRWSDEQQAAEWGKGYAEGWAAAILRILELRDVPSSDDHRYVSIHSDLRLLAQWLDLALLVTHGEDLIRAKLKAEGRLESE